MKEFIIPYIKQEQKEQVRNIGAADAGELNYEITMVLQAYYKKKGLRYAVINDILGALVSCQHEFYRRVVVPYENGKAFDNGDVY